MAQRQAKVTDFFQHRRKTIQSPSAKRVKFEESTSAIIQTEEKVWVKLVAFFMHFMNSFYLFFYIIKSLPLSTPDVTLTARPTDLSAKKRKNVAKSPVGETIIFSAPKSSGARRQLKFTKARRRLSGDKTEVTQIWVTCLITANLLQVNKVSYPLRLANCNRKSSN